MSVAPETGMSPAEYLAAENASTEKHEYVNGQIYAMSGGTPTHARVMFNAGRTLAARFEPGCMVFSSDLRIRVPETEMYTYPDVAMVCGRAELDPRDRTAVLNPSVLVEVLSPSTAGYDRGAKFAHYRHISSLRHYVVIDGDQGAVEVFTRREDGTWAVEFSEETGTFGVLGERLPVAELWLGLELLGEPPADRDARRPAPQAAGR